MKYTELKAEQRQLSGGVGGVERSIASMFLQGLKKAPNFYRELFSTVSQGVVLGSDAEHISLTLTPMMSECGLRADMYSCFRRHSGSGV